MHHESTFGYRDHGLEPRRQGPWRVDSKAPDDVRDHEARKGGGPHQYGNWPCSIRLGDNLGRCTNNCHHQGQRQGSYLPKTAYEMLRRCIRAAPKNCPRLLKTRVSSFHHHSPSSSWISPYCSADSWGKKYGCLNPDRHGPSRVMWRPRCGPINEEANIQVKLIAEADCCAEAN